MSRAFVREDDSDGIAALPGRPVSEHPNLVTEHGLALIEEAMEAVFGYIVLCDVTARDLQKNDGQWTRAKGFDPFCPVGSQVVAGVDPGNLSITLKQNGELRQDGNTSDMVFDVARLVSHISNFTTLCPGDLIATGTPEGVGPLAPGDRIEITIAGLGDLRFTVAREG